MLKKKRFEIGGKGLFVLLIGFIKKLGNKIKTIVLQKNIKERSNLKKFAKKRN